MTQPAPKFEVGQRVMVVAPVHPDYLDSNAVVTRSRYMLNEMVENIGGTIKMHTGWVYLTDDGVDRWAREESLRPRPEPGKLSFNELMKSVSQDTVNANLFEDLGGLVAPESEWCKQARSVFSEIERKVLNSRDISSNR